MYGAYGQIVVRDKPDAEFGTDFLKLGGLLFTGDVVGYDAVLRFDFVVTISDEVTLEATRTIDNNETGLQSFYLNDSRKFAPSLLLLY